MSDLIGEDRDNGSIQVEATEHSKYAFSFAFHLFFFLLTLKMETTAFCLAP